ncbi:MAG TPA: DUF58 domain-containing protein [Thermoanaerobaculia bacterium]|jgi:uncharacterized protein (DUF58 family)
MTALPWTFDGVVRLTRVGTTYIIFTIIIGFAALNTGNNALYIGLTFMLGCLLLSGIASKGGLKHLTVELVTHGEAWAGQPSRAKLRISNQSRIWNVRDVVIVADELETPVLVPVVRTRDAVELEVPLLFLRRGRVELRKLDFYTRYPFGFFLKKRRIRVASEVVVFPRLLEEEATRARFRPVTGEMDAANRPGPGSEIHSFREYVRGDSMRQVYWKKSAAVGRWIIKQTDMEAARVVNVIVDTYRAKGVSDDEFEEMISAAATFIHDLTGRGLDVILTLPRTTLRARTEQNATPLFRALALAEPTHEPVEHVVDRDTVVFSVQGLGGRRLGGWAEGPHPSPGSSPASSNHRPTAQPPTAQPKAERP